MNILIVSVDQNETIRLVHAVEVSKHIAISFKGALRASEFISNRLPVPCPIGFGVIAPSIAGPDGDMVARIFRDKNIPYHWLAKSGDYITSVLDAIKEAKEKSRAG